MASTDYLVLYKEWFYMIYNTYKKYFLDVKFRKNKDAWKYIKDKNL